MTDTVSTSNGNRLGRGSSELDDRARSHNVTFYRAWWILPATTLASGSPRAMVRDFHFEEEAVAFLRSLRSRFGEIVCCIERGSCPACDYAEAFVLTGDKSDWEPRR
jgi:hypothetical protein